MTRTAISPRLAIRIFFSTGANVGGVTSESVIRESPRAGGDWEVRRVAETGSTNDDLLAAADAGTASHLTALIAGHQTAGRGRLDRQWVAPPGRNLLVSLLFTHVPDEPSGLTQLVGMAAVEAIEDVAAASSVPLPDDLGLKWPNDVLVGGLKLAGVLAQRSASSGAVVVGTGLNVGWAPTDAVSLYGLGLRTDVDEVLAALLARLPRDRVRISEPQELRARYRERLLTLGRRVRVELPGDSFVEGVAVDVDMAGRLVVEESGGQHHTLDVGDVIHVRAG